MELGEAILHWNNSEHRYSLLITAGWSCARFTLCTESIWKESQRVPMNHGLFERLYSTAAGVQLPDYGRMRRGDGVFRPGRTSNN